MPSQAVAYNDLIARNIARQVGTREVFETLFGNVDRRLTSLESSQIAWERARQELIQLGLANLTEVLQPVADDLNALLHEAELRLAGITEGELDADRVVLLPIGGYAPGTVQEAVVDLKNRTDWLFDISDLQRELLLMVDPVAVVDAIGAFARAGGTVTGPTVFEDTVILAGPPTLGNHPATKTYVDGLVTGLNVKSAVKAASTGNVDIASAPASLDSTAGASGHRWLLKDQTDPAENGIYEFDATGQPLVRAGDMDTWVEVLSVAAAVENGTANKNTVWVTAVSPGGTLDTTPIVWNKFGSFQPAHDNLSALAGLSLGANKLPYATGAGALALTDLSSFARTILDDADAAAVRGTLGLGTAAVQAASTFATASHSHAIADTTGLQTALDGKQALHANLTSISGLAVVADKLPYGVGSNSFALADLTAFARTILDDANAATARTTLGLVEIATTGSASDLSTGTVPSGRLPNPLAALHGLTAAAGKIARYTGSSAAAMVDLSTFALDLLDDANAAAMRSTLGLVIGTDVQAYDADITALAALSGVNDLIYFNGSGTPATATLTSFARTILDDTNASGARTTLGLQIGTDVQAYDAKLAAFAGLTGAADRLAYFTGSSAMSLATLTSFARGLLDDTDYSAAITTLNLHGLLKSSVPGSIPPNYIAAGSGTGDYRSYTFSNDTDTGISNLVADTLNFITGGSERVRITNAGVGVGKTAAPGGAVDATPGAWVATGGYIVVERTNNPSLLLHRINANGSIATFSRNSTQVGDISVTTTNTAYNTSSDGRLKTNRVPLKDAIDVGTVIDGLKVFEFDWLDRAGKPLGERGIGGIAQEWATVLPSAVSPGVGDLRDPESSVWRIDYSKAVPVMVAELQSLRARVAQLEAS